MKKRLALVCGIVALALVGAGCGSWQVGDPPPDRTDQFPDSNACPPCTVCWGNDVHPCQPFGGQ